MKYLWRNKIAVLIVLVLIIFFQQTISLPEQSKTENIITAIGIDKTGDEFDVSIEYILPYKSGSENELKQASNTGKSVSEALEKINIEYGKNSAFAHCKIVVLNEECCDSDVTTVLDYFTRIKTNTKNIIVMNTSGSAKDVLSTAKDLNSDLYSVVNCNNFVGAHRQYQDFKRIGEYYDAFLSPTKCIAIGIVDTETDDSSTADTSSTGASGGASSSSSSGSSSKSSSTSSDSSESSSSSSSDSSSGDTKKFKCEGKMAIIKDGKRVLSLTADESENLNWFSPKVRDHFFTLENFTDEYVSNATLTFDVFEKSNRVRTYFDGDTPHYVLDLTLYMRTNEFVSGEMNEDYYNVLTKKFSDKLRSAIQDFIKGKLTLAEQNFKLNEYDVVHCYDNFYKYQNQQFKNYLASQGDEYFIKNVVFEYNINVMQQL
jgi:hypothetical protein